MRYFKFKTTTGETGIIQARTPQEVIRRVNEAYKTDVLALHFVFEYITDLGEAE